MPLWLVQGWELGTHSARWWPHTIQADFSLLYAQGRSGGASWAQHLHLDQSCSAHPGRSTGGPAGAGSEGPSLGARTVSTHISWTGGRRTHWTPDALRTQPWVWGGGRHCQGWALPPPKSSLEAKSHCGNAAWDRGSSEEVLSITLNP